MPHSSLSPTQSFAALKIGGASDKAALAQSGLCEAINDLFASTPSWRKCRDGKDWAREPGSDSVLFFPGPHNPEQEMVSVLFTPAREVAPYMMTIQGKKWGFGLSTTLPSGSQPILQITPERLQVLDDGDTMAHLKTLHAVLSGTVLSAKGDKPKTWSQIYPGFPPELR